MSLFIFLSLVCLPFFLVRWVRWLAVIQQKEYRLDRMLAFFRSDEGKQELFRILPRRSDFRRAGLKRPHLTPRVLLVALISGLILGAIWIVWMLSFRSWSLGAKLNISIISAIVSYLLLPVSIFWGALPSAIASSLVTFQTLRLAKKKLAENKVLIIGIGGSYGKTSTKHLLHHFLTQKYAVFVTPRSFNTKYSIAKSICDGYRGEAVALLEYGAYIRGEIKYLTGWFPPQLAIETGFTPQHLSLFGSREHSLLAEAELIAALPADGVAFCNGADKGADTICRLGAAKNKVRVVNYAGEAAVAQLENITLNQYGQLSCWWNGHQLQLQLIGRHYATNVQAAIAVSTHFSMTQEHIIAAAASFQPNSSFIQGRVLQTGAYVIDDGRTSNPMGFAAALNLLAELTYQQKIIITSGMVDLGSESTTIHLEIARQAQQIGAQVIHLGSDGKTEFREVFGTALLEDVTDAQQALAHSQQQTVILIEGKAPGVIEQYIEQLTERLV